MIASIIKNKSAIDSLARELSPDRIPLTSVVVNMLAVNKTIIKIEFRLSHILINPKIETISGHRGQVTKGHYSLYWSLQKVTRHNSPFLVGFSPQVKQN